MGIKQSNSDKNETNTDDTTSTTGVGAAAQSNEKNDVQEKPDSKAAEVGNATEFPGEQFPNILDKMESLDLEHRNVAKFLESVARGEQDKAEKLLKISQKLGGNPPSVWLLAASSFTDYSGRTFNCTAYEYAYWAKDAHMCRMLERYMDDETKAQMLSRVDAIESKGLSYRQNDKDYRSAHFDLEPLKNALKAYVDGLDRWSAWFEVGKKQRDVPAHVAQEYCRPDRSFNPTPQFNEATLPRVLAFTNLTSSPDYSWFPLRSTNSGLGFNFALMRWGDRWGGLACTVGPGELAAATDLAAITCLDEVRTVDLTQSRENLNPPAISQSPKA